jgi:phosphatidylglycerol:prolipoprotein diacylglycerol transferase
MWYGILVTLGIMSGIYVATSQIDGTRGISKDDFLDMILILIPVAVVTTRLWYVIFYDLEYYLNNPLQILNFRQGGMAIHGGILGGILVGFLYSRKKNLNFFYLFDIISPGLALGQGIGRWGNFINQEAHGGPTDLPWGIMIDGVKVHPTFLYESIADVAIFIFLYFYIRKRKKFDGQMCSLYLILYSTARFFIEGLRTDSLMIGPIRVAQLTSVILIIVGIIIYFTQKNGTKDN